MIYKTLVITGCVCLILAGIISAVKLKSYSLGIANICVGVANLIFMLK